MVEVRDVLGDPKFHQLPPEERRKVLGAIDPNFSGLPPLEQDKVLGIVAEPEPGQRGVAPWKIWTSRLARPVLEGGGLLAGGAVGATTGPVGAVAGGALGYGMGKKGSDLVDAALGLEVPTLEEGIKETPGLIAKGAAMEMGGQIAGKAIGAGAGLIAKGGQQVIGKLTGAGPGAIEEAAKATPAFRKAMRGKVSGDEIVESAKGALQTVKDARGAAYREKLAELSDDTTTIDMQPIGEKLERLMEQYNIKVNPGGKIDTSRIAMGKKGRRDILSVIKTISEWNREGDNTAVGLDVLKRQLDDFYSDSSQARGFVAGLRAAVKDTIEEAVPQYGEMTKGYAEATQIIKDFEAGLMLRKQGMTGRIVADQTLRRLMSAMRESSGLRKDLLDSLSSSSGKELSQMTAGYTLKGLMPLGLAGTGPAIVGEAALAKIVSPWFWPALSMSSPRVAGEFVQFMGRIATEAAGTAGLAGTLGVYGAGKAAPNAP